MVTLILTVGTGIFEVHAESAELTVPKICRLASDFYCQTARRTNSNFDPLHLSNRLSLPHPATLRVACTR